MSLVSNDPHFTNQLASDWMHRGMDWANDPSANTLGRAVRCFDEAIALRRTLPLQDNPFFRYGLSAGWINRGDAMAKLRGSGALDDAINSYDEALLLLETLPLEENALYPRRLAITWINRGTVLQGRETSGAKWEATQCFREAIAVLVDSSAKAIPDQSLLLAGAWTNLAGSLDDSSDEDSNEIRASVRKALELTRASESAEESSAQIGLKARHILCRLATKRLLEKRTLPGNEVAETTDAVDDAMALARHRKFHRETETAGLVRHIFRFGCRLYANGQPHFLAEFLLECTTSGLVTEMLLSDEETFDAAMAAIWTALGNLQTDGFPHIATEQFDPYLSDVVELRKVEERLKEFRLVQATVKNTQAAVSAI